MNNFEKTLDEMWKPNKKAEKALDDMANSDEGTEFNAAWNDGDERKINILLTRNGIKGKLQQDVLDIMFDGD